MAIEFRCAECGQPLRVEDDDAGRVAQCPGCGSITPIPVGTYENSLDSGIERKSTSAEGPRVGTEVADSRTGDNPYQSPVEPAAPVVKPSPPAPTSIDTNAAASLTLGITSLILCACCPLLGVPFSIGGLYMGIRAIKSPTLHNRALPIVGLVFSSLGLVLGILIGIGYSFVIMPNPWGLR
jgi:hypothetical protein